MLRLLSSAWLLLLLVPSLADAAEWKADPPKQPNDWKPSGSPIPFEASLFQITFAEHFGPYAVLSEAKPKTDRIVYDLRTGKEFARVPEGDSPPFSMPELLSPDGKYLARLKQTFGKVLELTTVEGNVVRKVELPTPAADYAWLDSDRLIVVLWSGPTSFAIVDAGTGKVGTPVGIPGKAFQALGPMARLFAVSSGGRYAAIPTEAGIALFDTSTASVEMIVQDKLVAAKSLSGLPLPPALCFSADGSQLAMLTGGKPPEGSLRIWTAGSETLKTVAVARSKNAGSSTVRPLDAVRSGGWFVDAENLLNADGESVRLLPNDFTLSQTARSAHDADTVIAVKRELTSTKRHELGVIRESGAKEKAVRPGDFSKVRKIPASTEAFLGSFEPAPAAEYRTPYEVDAKDSRSIVALHVARTGQWGVVELDVSGTEDNTLKRGVAIWAEGASKTPAEIPVQRRVFGEMADDSGFLTLETKTTQPPTLAFHAPTGDMLCQWRPTEQTILYAAVVSRNRVVTLDRTGALVGWKVPQCEAEWKVDLPNAGIATLSPNASRILVATPKGLHIHSAEFGTAQGTIDADLGNALATGALCVRGDGNQIVASAFVGTGYRYTVWNLSGNRSTKQFSGPASINRGLVHLGGDLVFDGFNVVDLQRGSAVWMINAGSSKAAKSQPSDGRLWQIVPSTIGSNPRVAQAVSFPRKGLEALLAENDQAPERYLQPGSKVRLEVDWSAAPAKFQAAALAKAKERLSAGKVEIADDAPLTLHLSASTKPTGETLNLTWQDTKKLGQQETIKPYTVRCTSELRLGGKVLKSATSGEFQMDTGRSNLVVTITDDSATAKEFFDRQVWNRALGWAGSYLAIPGAFSVSATGQAITLPGMSTVKLGGLETAWPQGFTPPPEESVGSRPADSDPGSATAEPGAKTGHWILFAACGGAVVLLMGIAGIGLIVWMMRKKKPPVKVARKAPPE